MAPVQNCNSGQSKKIGYRAFSEKNVVSVEIPDSVTEIGNFAFAECTSLTSIVIPKNVSKVGVGVFQNDRNLSYCEIKNPDLKEFGNGSFDDCKKLKTVVLPANLKKNTGKYVSGCKLS